MVPVSTSSGRCPVGSWSGPRGGVVPLSLLRVSVPPKESMSVYVIGRRLPSL